jgi:hypothetical protein
MEEYPSPRDQQVIHLSVIAMLLLSCMHQSRLRRFLHQVAVPFLPSEYLQIV